MPDLPPVAIVFAALAVLFIGLSCQGYLKGERMLTAARKTWLRVGVIFAIVSIALLLVQWLGQ